MVLVKVVDYFKSKLKSMFMVFNYGSVPTTEDLGREGTIEGRWEVGKVVEWREGGGGQHNTRKARAGGFGEAGGGL